MLNLTHISEYFIFNRVSFYLTGANVNTQNEMGMTPLHCAVDVENVFLVTLLVENGADVNLRNNDGKTAAKLAFKKIAEKRKIRADSQSLWDIMDYLSEK